MTGKMNPAMQFVCFFFNRRLTFYSSKARHWVLQKCIFTRAAILTCNLLGRVKPTLYVQRNALQGNMQRTENKNKNDT